MSTSPHIYRTYKFCENRFIGMEIVVGDIYIYKGDWDFQISDPVKNPDGTDI